MRRGPKPELPSVKAKCGTLRPHRDRLKVEVLTSSALPVKPDWLSAAGELIWRENITRAAALGLTEHDSVIFALFCNLTGEIAQTVRAGNVVSIAAQTEARRLAELLGLAGPKSRIIMGNPPPELGIELAIVAAVGHGWAQGAKPELFTFTSGDLALKGFVWKPEGPRSISSDCVQSRQRKGAGHR